MAGTLGQVLFGRTDDVVDQESFRFTRNHRDKIEKLARTSRKLRGPGEDRVLNGQRYVLDSRSEQLGDKKRVSISEGQNLVNIDVGLTDKIRNRLC